MDREPYWDYMARRLREERPMYNALHLKLDDQEKRKVTAVFDDVDFLKKEVAQLQENLQNKWFIIRVLLVILKLHINIQKRGAIAPLLYNLIVELNHIDYLSIWVVTNT